MCDAVLDRTHVRYSYRQQCLVSITVDGVPGTPTVTDPSQWHLPTYDPRNENKYHYRLHSLDIYFWTHADALQFVNGVRRVLPPQQVEVTDEPAPPPAFAPPPVRQQQHHHHQQQQHQHHDQMNPLVNKLERAAISDPRYGGGSAGQTPSRSSSTAAAHGAIAIPSFDPPPVSAVHGSAAEDAAPPPSFAPMAYNPAAPAAPEQIRHREKTPPPPEDDGPDPLQAAVARDHAPAFAPAYGGGGVGGPMSPGFPPSAVASPGFPPTQFGHLQRSATMPVSAGLSSPYGAGFPGSPGFAPPPPPGPPPATAHSHSLPSAQAPPTPGLSPPPTQQLAQHQQHQQYQHQQFQNPLQSPGAPPGGFSNYSYTSSPAPGSAQGGGGSDWSIHKQVYRPTEFEATADHEAPKREGRGKLGQNADRIERGVSGVLKKLEKKFG